MTVIIRIGRRVPISLKQRMVEKVKSIIGFQSHIWVMIKMSMDMARKQWRSGKKKPEGKMLAFDIEKELEKEDEFWRLEWMIIRIQGDERCELAEYEEAQGMYDALRNNMKAYPKDAKDERLSAVFKTKLMNAEKMKEAYEKGYGAKKDKTVAEILLEMGIVTHIELIPDYDERNNMPDITG